MEIIVGEYRWSVIEEAGFIYRFTGIGELVVRGGAFE
jgi:hypothetical protein